MLARRSAQRCSAAGAVITIGRADFLAGSVRGLKTFPRRRRAFATLVPNVAFGPVSRLDEPFSFWGGFVSATDTIIDFRRHRRAGRSQSYGLVRPSR